MSSLDCNTRCVPETVTTGSDPGPKAAVQMHRHRSSNSPAPARLCARVSAVQLRRHCSSKGSRKGPAPALKSSANFNLVVPPQSLLRCREPVVALLKQTPSLSRIRRESDANSTRTLQLPPPSDANSTRTRRGSVAAASCASKLCRPIDYLPKLWIKL